MNNVGTIRGWNLGGKMKVNLELDLDKTFGEQREVFLQYLRGDFTLEELCARTNTRRNHAQQLIGWIIDECVFENRVKINPAISPSATDKNFSINSNHSLYRPKASYLSPSAQPSLHG